MRHYILKFRIQLVQLLHIVPTPLRIRRRVRAVGRSKRIRELLADARRVARGRPDVLVRLRVGIRVVMLSRLHALDGLLVEQLHAVHERHDAQVRVVYTLKHGLDPRVRLAADVDEHVGIADGNDVFRRRLIGVHLAAGAQQHRDRHIVSADLAREIVGREDRRDDVELAVVRVRILLHGAARKRRHGQHHCQQHTQALTHGRHAFCRRRRTCRRSSCCGRRP